MSALISKKERWSWYAYDWANSAFSATVVAVFLGPYLTDIAQNAAGESGYLYIFGIPIFASSYFTYIISFSVILQVIFLPMIGAIADYTNKKKVIFTFFSLIGAFSTMSMYFLEGKRYLLGGGLFIIANLAFGLAMVVYNAYLIEISEPEERDNISSKGWAAGYIGGGILLLMNVILYSKSELFGISGSFAIRISLCSAGVWWALFSLFPIFSLKQRRRVRDLPEKQSFLTVGFYQFRSALKNMRNYPKTLWFLIAYLLYNDGIQTVIAVSAQFGYKELGLDLSVLTQTILLIQFVAFAGALLFNKLAKISSTKNAIITGLIIWICLVLYAYQWLNSAMGFYILGALIGLVLGGTQALSRSAFSRLIPYGQESEYFSLYELSERGTSWMGTIIFGLSLQFTGSYRIALLSILFFFISGTLLLFFLNLNKAMENMDEINKISMEKN